MPDSLADIAVPLPLYNTFTYLVPPELQALAKPGCRVLIPFGRKHLSGVIVASPERSTLGGLKHIKDVLDLTPSFSSEMLELCRWISEYYVAPFGEVLKAALPQGLSLEGRRIVRLKLQDPLSSPTSRADLSKKQLSILDVLKVKDGQTIPQLLAKTRARNIHATVNEMARQRLVDIEDRIPQPGVRVKHEKVIQLTARGLDLLAMKKPVYKLTAKQTLILNAIGKSRRPVREILQEIGTTSASLKTLGLKGLLTFEEVELKRESLYENLEPPPQIVLNSHQQAAIQEIEKTVEAGVYKAFLLLGVTGSGKTEVYIEAIRKTLAKGKTAIVLVPEISLTPQTVRRFKAHFGADVAVMHSHMSLGERYDSWRAARDGNAKIVIGPRSAVFAPLPNLGLIVVDEEQEASYKQFDSVPRYNARDVAIVRARSYQAVVVLGSATPSAESYHNAQEGKYRLLELPERVDNARLPQIDIIDMVQERKRALDVMKQRAVDEGKGFPKRFPRSSVSQLLKDALVQRLEKKEGVILLQNRRGFSHVMECYDCGFVERCDSCDVSLTYHQTKKHLRCHYCGFVKTPPTVCPQCQSAELRLHSFGTQQVEQELSELFPTARIERMDLDTTSRKGSHDKILQRFGKREADILLGTQMVAKGLDFPHVTLVGVISADTQMMLPDFRASERTFQLLTQVAGRAGRRSQAGEVIVQTLQPGHYSLKHVVSHDVKGFYEEELAYRRELDYPPFSRIVLLEFQGEHEEDVHRHAKTFADYLDSLNREKCFIVLGPADAVIPRIRNRFRKHVILKDLRRLDPAGASMRLALLKARQQYDSSPLGKSRKVRLIVDIDPQGMM